MRIVEDRIHKFGKNELGDQLSHVSLTIWDKARGLSVVSKLVENAIRNTDFGKQGGGTAISLSDIGVAIGMLGNYAEIIASNVGNLQEVLSGTDTQNALNKLEADRNVFDYEFQTRPQTYSEIHTQKTA